MKSLKCWVDLFMPGGLLLRPVVFGNYRVMLRIWDEPRSCRFSTSVGPFIFVMNNTWSKQGACAGAWRLRCLSAGAQTHVCVNTALYLMIFSCLWQILKIWTMKLQWNAGIMSICISTDHFRSIFAENCAHRKKNRWDSDSLNDATLELCVSSATHSSCVAALLC